MEDIYALLKLFGERYIFCDDEQAKADAMPENRDELVSAFCAVMHTVEISVRKGNE